MVITSGIGNAQHKEIPLYKGAAPGSENWTWQEKTSNKNSIGLTTVYNVVNPTLTVVPPDPAVANGTGVIICPGGGFHFLAINHEGYDVAKELSKMGFTVFVLKYRLVHISGDNPFDDMISTPDHKAWDEESYPIIPLAVADGREAIAYVRNHAAEYKIATNNIGIMGFSAGGMVAALTAFNYTAANRPDFVVPVYGDIPDSRLSKVLPDAPPIYLLCTADDEFGFSSHAINLYKKWYEAKRPAELHIFAKGGHGFGVGNVNNTTYKWLGQFANWLAIEGLMKSK
jgi:acetyl esterase/lipase